MAGEHWDALHDAPGVGRLVWDYTAFIGHAADLALQSGVPLAGLNVGTELDGTHAHASEWRALIAGVRAKLPGTPLWLGPNWEWQGVPGYTLVTFWDALDFLGVDMYAPLALHDDPTIAEATLGWQPIVDNLTAFWTLHGSPTKGFIFAEIGYASYAGAATNAPGCCTGPPDLSTQAVLYQSFFDAVWTQPWMSGVFWWAWPASPPGGTPCSTGFDVYGKPAAAVLTKYYTAGRETSAAAVVGYGADAAVVPHRGGAAPASAPSPIYSNGVTAWADWSWGATTDLQDGSDPYPSHAASARVVVNGTGAMTLHAPGGGATLGGHTSLEFDLIVPNATFGTTLSAFLCTCDDCSGEGCSHPPLELVQYAATGQACTLARDWAGQPSRAHVVLPLDLLLPDRTPTSTVSRVQVAVSGAWAPVVFLFDNMQLV